MFTWRNPSRHYTGALQNGHRSKSRKHSVSRSSQPCGLHPRIYATFLFSFTDVAEKLNLIGPIAEQCQHQCVPFLINTYRHSVFVHVLVLFGTAFSTASDPSLNTRK